MVYCALLLDSIWQWLAGFTWGLVRWSWLPQAFVGKTDIPNIYFQILIVALPHLPLTNR